MLMMLFVCRLCGPSHTPVSLDMCYFAVYHEYGWLVTSLEVYQSASDGFCKRALEMVCRRIHCGLFAHLGLLTIMLREATISQAACQWDNWDLYFRASLSGLQ
jgi:hypothetical protein